MLAALRSRRRARGSCAPRSRKAGQCQAGSAAAGSASRPIHSFIPGWVRRQVGGGCGDSVRSLDFLFPLFMRPFRPWKRDSGLSGLAFSQHTLLGTRRSAAVRAGGCGSDGALGRSCHPRPPACRTPGPRRSLPRRARGRGPRCPGDTGPDRAVAPRGRVRGPAAARAHRAGFLSN